LVETEKLLEQPQGAGKSKTSERKIAEALLLSAFSQKRWSFATPVTHLKAVKRRK